MSKTAHNAPAAEPAGGPASDGAGTPYAPILRYLQEERRQRCEAVQAQAGEEIARIQADCEARTEALLASGRDAFDALRRSINFAVVGPARREIDAVASRKMGEAVEQILSRCRDRLQDFAASAAFGAALEALMLEALASAQGLERLASREAVRGVVRVAAADVAPCQAIVDRHGLGVTVEADASVWGGVELVVGDGRHRIRNTLGARLEKQHAALRAGATQKIQQALAGNK